MLTVHQQTEFERIARPLIEFLLMNCPPDATVVVTNREAQLLESAAAVPLYRTSHDKVDHSAAEMDNVISITRFGDDKASR